MCPVFFIYLLTEGKKENQEKAACVNRLDTRVLSIYSQNTREKSNISIVSVLFFSFYMKVCVLTHFLLQTKI
jgi:hypothetical protein